MSIKFIQRFSFSTFLSFLCIGYSTEATAQPDTIPNREQFLLQEFSPGIVAMKTGKDLGLILNYSIITEKMVFIQKGKIYEFLNPGSVDTVYMKHRKFIPVGKAFYEVLCDTPVLLFAEYKGFVEAPLKTDPYGQASQASATTSIYNMKVSSVFYVLNDPDVKIDKEIIYWIRLNNKLSSFKDAVQLYKVFPEKKGEIREYIRQNKPDFKIPDNILRLILYCNGLTG